VNKIEVVTKRARQREETRDRIVEAALEAFAERGFLGASTRDIAQRADTNQGLITYHFKSKDELWRAAADRIFDRLEASMGEQIRSLTIEDPRERAREAIRAYIRFVAIHPELFRLMVDEGKNSDQRMEWLVDTHLKPRFEAFMDFASEAVPEIDPEMRAHAYYTMAGAGSLIFAVAPECRRLTGLDPESAKTIEAHANFVAHLLVP
jgi:AcrR family transcriptional regulator